MWREFNIIQAFDVNQEHGYAHTQRIIGSGLGLTQRGSCIGKETLDPTSHDQVEQLPVI